ncbi:MAG: hypothetical protein U5K29_08035 [Acidimicrobiales bacterium]|nr:hypothetical protein [Acidimicrobiales bacterium]
MNTRLLILDDSGKPDAGHASGAVVIAGLSIDTLRYPALSRRVLGAKARFYPGRGVPQGWEVKSSGLVKPNPWNRANNRNFAHELARIVSDLGGTFYAATITKANLHHPMTLATTMPLQLQCLVEHFEVECRATNSLGMVIADWSTHQFDQHASRCVASFAASRKLRVHPGVYYASSHGNEGVQVADVVAAVRRRAVEGDTAMAAFDAHLASIRPAKVLSNTCTGRSFTNYVTVI